MRTCANWIEIVSVAVLAAGACPFTGSSARAATITWTDGPTTVTSVNDIDLTGTLVHAGRWGYSSSGETISVTVGAETIPFARRPFNTTDGYAGATGAGEYTNPNLFAAPAGFDANFDAVLDGLCYDGGNPKDITLDGLTAGHRYQIQLFVSDDRPDEGGIYPRRTQKWSDSGSIGGHETSTFANGDSPFVIGRFTADGTSEHIYLWGVGDPANNINAYVLRDISNVPEPGAIVLLGVGLTGLLAYAWRKSK